MNTRRIFSLLLNLAAVLGPTAALYARYGLDTRIQRNDGELLLPVVGAMVVSFLVGTISARTLQSTAEGLSSVFQALVRAFHDANTHTKRRTA